MFNKLYTNISLFIKENIKYIILVVFVYLIFTVKVPYSIECPGGTINANKRLENVKYDSKGSINLTYVSFIRGTIPTVLLSYVLPEWDLVKNSEVTLEGEDIKESLKREEISLKSSISNAKYVAYKKAGIDLKVTNTEHNVVYIDKESDTDLRIGDNIYKYDDIIFEDLNSFKEYIDSKNRKDIVKFQVKNDEKIEEKYAKVRKVDNNLQIGIMVTTVNNYESKDTVNYTSKSSESGSSGGLMIALAIYNSITNDDITKGQKICGTGTIESDGKVGEIGGVKYKLSGAVKKNCDVFIAPKDNYKEALKLKEKNNYNIRLIEGISFDQVLDELKI